MDCESSALLDTFLYVLQSVNYGGSNQGDPPLPA